MKLSVIIPVYNAAKYINPCLESLFRQTLQNIEFIFIDDASQDDSIQVIKSKLAQYPQREAQTIIISNPTNMGPSATRNVGLDLCSGDYVAFCDADDELYLDAYEKMLNVAKESNAEIVSCGVRVKGIDKESVLFYPKGFSISLKSLCHLNEVEGILFSSLWNRIISRDLFETYNVRFNNSLRMWDDLYVSFMLRYYCKLDVILNEPLYCYNHLINNKSVTSEDVELKWRSQVRCAQLLEQFLNEQRETSRYRYLISFIKFHSKHLLFSHDGVDKWLSLFPETHSDIMKFLSFYGPTRTMRYFLVILLKKNGWKLLHFYSRLKIRIRNL